MFEGPDWKRFREMISEGGKLSLSRVLTLIWFIACFGMALMFIYAVGTAFITGEEMKFPEGLLSTILLYFTGILTILFGYVFGSKTKLNFQNKTVEPIEPEKKNKPEQ